MFKDCEEFEGLANDNSEETSHLKLRLIAEKVVYELLIL